jgi:hypothetical protein
VSGKVVAATKGSATKGAAVTKPAAKPAHKVARKHAAVVKPGYKFKSATDIAFTSMSVTSATAATSMSVNPLFKVPAKV